MILLGVELEEDSDPSFSTTHWWYPKGTCPDLDSKPATGVELAINDQYQAIKYRAVFRYEALSVAMGKGATLEEAESKLIASIEQLQTVMANTLSRVKP